MGYSEIPPLGGHAVRKQRSTNCAEPHGSDGLVSGGLNGPIRSLKTIGVPAFKVEPGSASSVAELMY